jgi:hypothetical protein
MKSVYVESPTNPIASVWQARKRVEEPEILEPAEITAVLRALTALEGGVRVGVTPVGPPHALMLHTKSSVGVS